MASSAQRLDFENWLALCGQGPISHQFLLMDRYLGLKNAQFLKGQFTFNEFPVWNRNNHLAPPILHVQVWQVMLLAVHVKHADNQTVKHADGGHSEPHE